MIRKAMEHCNKDFQEGFYHLIKDGELITQVRLDTSFYEYSSTACLWGLFVNAGYLTIEEVISYENNKCRIKIPNNEVRNEFITFTESLLSLPEGILSVLFDYLTSENKDGFLKTYQDILMIPSYLELLDEHSYHMMSLGMCAFLYGKYEVISNREVGKGRADIILKANIANKPSFIFEFKYTKNNK